MQKKPILVVIVVLAALGVLVSAELARLHYAVYLDPDHQSWCQIGAVFDCAAVERSAWAVLFNVPVAVWGALGYLVVLLVAASGIRQRTIATWPSGLLLLISTLFVLISIQNAYVSLIVLGKVCLLCSASYAINVSLLIISAFLIRRQHGALFAVVARDMKALVANWRYTFAATIAFFVCASALMQFYPRYWDSWQGRELGPGAFANGVDSNGVPWIGAQQPLLTIIEYSDYECPFCAHSHAVVRALLNEYAEQVRIVHRHFPLDDTCNDLLDRPMHINACHAALAAVCAAEQSAFWQMNDALFTHQKQLGVQAVDQLARQLGLDMARFQTCLEADTSMRKLAHDITSASSFDARGTPLYVVNGEVIRGALDVTQAHALVKKALSKKGNAAHDSAASSTPAPIH